ncbi:ATP-binding protein, partial [Neobacillus vireti]|uniref:ATP-binding protein n=1 Tax=Neobacillus vireti TaxID=220686 RepID=UPI0030008744
PKGVPGMKGSSTRLKLFYEEKKAIQLFLWLFYIFFISFELIYYYIYPYYGNGVITRPNQGLGFWIYIINFGLLPLAIYLIKKGNPYIIKYLYIYSFLLWDTIHNFLLYYGKDESFAAGDIVEVVFILFSPIFVNKKYFWTVSLGMVLKYVFFGVILLDLEVLVPLFIYIILSAIAFVILNRFESYIESVNKAHEELRRKEKLAVIGQMAAAIGHEIRNPLSSLKGFTQLQHENYPNTNDFYPIMIQEIDRINSIVNDLMTLGKPKIVQFSKVGIEEIIDYTLSLTKHLAERQGITTETIMERPSPPLDCDPKQLKQLFINLIKNAIESMPNGGKITITVKVEGNKMNISIQDEGGGISDEDFLNIGEPFFTTKKEGTGLGLMVSNQIIKDHFGEFYINGFEKGTLVKVMLPINQK